MNDNRIADPSDLATQQEQMFLDAALTLRKSSGPEPCGHCLNCETPLGPGKRWCDTDCRRDWERFEARA